MLVKEWDWETAIKVRSEENFEMGVEEGRLRTARAMIDKGFDVDTIVEITGLSPNHELFSQTPKAR